MSRSLVNRPSKLSLFHLANNICAIRVFKTVLNFMFIQVPMKPQFMQTMWAWSPWEYMARIRYSHTPGHSQPAGDEDPGLIPLEQQRRGKWPLPPFNSGATTIHNPQRADIRKEESSGVHQKKPEGKKDNILCRKGLKDGDGRDADHGIPPLSLQWERSAECSNTSYVMTIAGKSSCVHTALELTIACCRREQAAVLHPASTTSPGCNLCSNTAWSGGVHKIAACSGRSSLLTGVVDETSVRP